MALPGPETLLYVVLTIAIILVAIVVVRPSLTATRGGKVFTFLAFFLLPILCVFAAGSEHIELSKQTTFCLSCHIMEPYGKSLDVDDAQYVPAAHFQNHRIPSEEACYTCHTDYALYGGVRAKLRGLHHIYVQYLGKLPQPDQIKLYTPYNNRECLHCHLGARSFQGNAVHMAILDSLKNNEMSCIASGCHDTIHNVGGLNKVKFWSPAR